MQSETAFKNKVRAALKTLPGCWFVKTQQVAIRGTPDLLCCIGGRFVALELKRSQEAKADPLQAYMLAQIENAGGVAVVAHPDNWADVFSVLVALSSYPKTDIL